QSKAMSASDRTTALNAQESASSMPMPLGAPPTGAQRSLRLPSGALWVDVLPRYAALVGILALSVVLNTHRLAQNGYANTFYSAGVRSMLQSWHNFFFVSFDPGGLVTIDKPPLGVWVQAASAHLFGLSPLSLLLPEAIVSTCAVAVLYRVIGRRPGGSFGPLRLSLVRGGLARQWRRPSVDLVDDPRLRGGLECDRRRALALAARLRGAGRA